MPPPPIVILFVLALAWAAQAKDPTPPVVRHGVASPAVTQSKAPAQTVEDVRKVRDPAKRHTAAQQLRQDREERLLQTLERLHALETQQISEGERRKLHEILRALGVENWREALRRGRVGG